MNTVIGPDDLHLWLPGKVLLDSAVHGWEGIRLRNLSYGRSDVMIPPMQDFKVVIYTRGATHKSRRCAGDWKTEHVSPGAISILTQAVPSYWRWDDPIEASHLYLSPKAVADVAVDVFERTIEEIDLYDILRTDDQVLPLIAAQLACEAHTSGIGERTYTESLRLQASIHLLRRYANVTFRDNTTFGQFSPAEKRHITDYVDHTLDLSITLEDLAAQVGLSVYHFCRKFRATFTMPPHAWLLEQRVARAMSHIRNSKMPLKLIALEAGFSDQSHMTRAFRRMAGVTPGEYRGNFASAIPA